MANTGDPRGNDTSRQTNPVASARDPNAVNPTTSTGASATPAEISTPGRTPVDPDVQCAVGVASKPGARCKVRLDCRYHSEAQKRAVPDRSRPYDELLQLIPIATRDILTRNSAAASLSTVIDLDKHCGVLKADGIRCRRLLNSCPYHPDAAKNALQGRSTSYRNLQRVGTAVNLDVHCGVLKADGGRCRNGLGCAMHTEDQKKAVERRSTTDLETQCAVALADGGQCQKALDCTVHNRRQKSAVTGRSLAFDLLLKLQIDARSGARSLHGYGMILAPAREDEKIRDIRRRYRRTGMQTATLQGDADGEVREPAYTMLSPSGEALNRLRQMVFGQIHQDPQHDIEDLLPQRKIRNTSEGRAGRFLDSDVWHFYFVSKPIEKPNKIAHLERLLLSNPNMYKDNCIISATNDIYKFDSASADAVLLRLRSLIERFPLGLSRMSEAMKRTFLHHAMSSPRPGGVLPKIPYTVEKATVDNKPCLVVGILSFEEDFSTTYMTSVALPILDDPKDVAVPQAQTFYEFFGQDYGQQWLGHTISREKQKQLFDIAAYLVSTLHLRPNTPQLMNTTLSRISRNFDVALLVMQGGDTIDVATTTPGILAIYDQATSTIKASPEAAHLAPWLPDITGIVDDMSGHLSTETINMRYLHTQDWLLAWSDGSNASDMHRIHGTAQFALGCMCSAEQAKIETHTCVCGADTVCDSLARVLINGVEVPLCPKCRPLEERSADGVRGATGGGVSGGQGTGARGAGGGGARGVQGGGARGAQGGGARGAQGGGTRGARGARGARGGGARGGTRDVLNMARARYRPSEKSRIRDTMNTEINKEHGLVYPNKAQPEKRRAEMLQAYSVLDQQYQATEDGQGWQWTDVYLESPIVKDNSLLMCSVEAFSPLVFVEGKARVHVHGNLGLTKLYANKLCGSNIPIALQLFHRLDAATNDEEIEEVIEHINHLHLQRSQIPWQTKPRIAIDSYSSDFMREWEQQSHAGAPTVSGCKRIATRNGKPWRYVTITDTTTPEDDLEDIVDVRAYIESLESQNPSHQLRKINGVPYPFRGGPVPPDWSWTLLYGYVGVHLATLRRTCNNRHLNTFTLSRLVCIFCRQLFLGRRVQPTQLLDVPVSIYRNYLLKSSVGKADHARAMSTGHPEGLPISIANFKEEDSNLCIEPWLCNSCKGHRDAETDAIRDDFRSNLRADNAPHWHTELPVLDRSLTAAWVCTSLVVRGHSTNGPSDDEADDRDGPPMTWSPVPHRRNLANMGETCYMSTVLETFHDNTDVQAFVADRNNFLFKDKTGQQDVDFLPHNELPGDLTPAEVLEFRIQRRSAQRLFCKAVRDLFVQLSAGGQQLGRNVTQTILRRIQAIDDRWQNVSNESAELLSVVLDNIISAADRSNDDQLLESSQAMSLQQERDNKDAIPLIDLAADAERYWKAFIQEGHDTDLTERMYTQAAQEVPCGDPDCSVVSRGFETTHIFYLDFPSDRGDLSQYTIEELLDNWATDVSQGHSCEHRPEDHAPGLDCFRCFTRPAKFISLAIRRGGVGAVHVFNLVEISEELDISPYTQMEDMPSNKLYEDVVDDPTANREAIFYDLVGVNVWKSGHYIAYVRDFQAGENEGSWIMFNDLLNTPLRKTPFQGISDGELVHYAVYRRREEPATEPPIREAAPRAQTGHDDDAAMPDYNDAEGLHAPGQPQRKDNATGASETAAVRSHESPRVTRPRPESSNAEMSHRNVQARGDLTSDVVSARAIAAVEARESALDLNEGAMMRSQAKLQQDEEDLMARISALQLREQRVVDREREIQQAATWLAQRNARRDEIREEIRQKSDAYDQRELHHALRSSDLHKQRQAVINEIEQLQAKLDSLGHEQEEITQAAEAEKKDYEQELSALQMQLIGLLNA